MKPNPRESILYGAYTLLYDYVFDRTGIDPGLEDVHDWNGIIGAIQRLESNYRRWTEAPPLTDQQREKIIKLCGILERPLPKTRLGTIGAAYLINQLAAQLTPERLKGAK